MKLSTLVGTLLVAVSAFTLTGCAVFTKGKSQTVVVRSVPAGAVAKINGTEVGRTPFKVDLPRSEVYRIDFEKAGFSPQSALLMPTSSEYDRRLLRWGIDYDLGAANDLLPGEVVVELKPQLGELTLADRYLEMTAQINRADAMLSVGQISAADHKYLVEQITATYHAK